MTEILCNLEKGTMRAAVDGVELARYTHPTPSERKDPEKRIIPGPIGLFRHGGGASEYKDVYVEANPKEDVLITVRIPAAPQEAKPLEPAAHPDSRPGEGMRARSLSAPTVAH
jgi:hypothetical protein